MGAATTPIIKLPPVMGGQKNYGIITYGEYTFSPFRNVTVQCTPVYDEADRVVTHLKYLLRCYDCVLQNDLQDVHQINMDAMQDVLTTPGLQLIVRDIGFDGPLDTMLGSPTFTTPDIIWGPKPRLLGLRPYGEICWVFDWEIEFNISRCLPTLGLIAAGNGLMAWNYEVNFRVGANGLVESRTTSGYLQVMAVHGQGANFLSVLANVDKTWDSIPFVIPYGFQRVANDRTINKAKNRIDFTIVDRELPGAAFPPGVVHAEARLDLKSMQGGLAAWTGTLQASYEVAPGFPKSLAVAKFLTLLNDRVTRLKKALTFSSKDQATIVPVGMAISHELYERTTDIAVSFILPTTADALIEKSGVWEPLPENDWQAWATSLQKAGVTSNRGYSGVGFDPSQDSLVTICIGAPPPAAQLGNLHDGDGEEDENDDDDDAAVKPVSGGYILYETAVHQEKSENFTVHRYAQNYQPGSTGYQDHTTEYQSAPDNFIVMTGRAVRVDSLPDPPQILTVGGQQVELLKKDCPMDDKPKTLVFGHKIYTANWEIWYRVKGEPSTPNPTALAIVAPAAIEPLESPDDEEPNPEGDA